MSNNIKNYTEKINILSILTKTLYDELEFEKNYFCLDGGESTGTTTVSIGMAELLKKAGMGCVWVKEPDHYEEPIRALLNDKKSMDNPSIMNSLIELFTKDRHYTQGNFKRLPKGTVKVSDRSLFSTIIYQSGILSNINSIDDIDKNCDKIREFCLEYQIKLPQKCFLFIHSDNDKDIMEIFKFRLSKRGITDRFDDDKMILPISHVYRDLCLSLKSVPEVISIDFTKDAAFLSDKIFRNITS